MAKLTLVEAVNLALKQEMEWDPRVLVLGEDVGRNGGVFRVTQGLYDLFGEARVIDTPLSESAIVGAAIALAALGYLPLVLAAALQSIPDLGILGNSSRLLRPPGERRALPKAENRRILGSRRLRWSSTARRTAN